MILKFFGVTDLWGDLLRTMCIIYNILHYIYTHYKNTIYTCIMYTKYISYIVHIIYVVPIYIMYTCIGHLHTHIHGISCLDSGDSNPT